MLYCLVHCGKGIGLGYLVAQVRRSNRFRAACDGE